MEVDKEIPEGTRVTRVNTYHAYGRKRLSFVGNFVYLPLRLLLFPLKEKSPGIPFSNIRLFSIEGTHA